MRVIVTRPEHSGERTARKLIEYGHQPLLLPLTAPLYDIDAVRRALAASKGAIAITSAEAVRATEMLGAEIARHLDRPLFAVGKASEEEAARVGFANRHHSQGDGADLADLIAATGTALGGEPVTYLAGSPRAAGFEARLAALKIACSTVECYRMVDIEPDKDALEALHLDEGAVAILLYSRHTAERFVSLDLVRRSSGSVATVRFLCLSPAIAEAIPPSLHGRIEIAPTPDEESLLALLEAT